MKFSSELYQVHSVEEHIIQSNLIDQKFRIRVQQPDSLKDGSERFPILYLTDGDFYFDVLSILSSMLQGEGEVSRFILVGIGYEKPKSPALLRWRDFYTHSDRPLFQAQIEQGAKSQSSSHMKNLRNFTHTTDARDFLRFICEELMPFVNSKYPALPADSGYFGYSSGGAFGLYTLFAQPNTFKRYILGSPVTSYGGQHFGNGFVDAFIRTGKSTTANVFLSVGELEEFEQVRAHFDLVTGLYLLAKRLGQAAIPGLDWSMRVFPRETHATAWTMAFNHGVKALFAFGES